MARDAAGMVPDLACSMAADIIEIEATTGNLANPVHRKRAAVVVHGGEVGARVRHGLDVVLERLVVTPAGIAPGKRIWGERRDDITETEAFRKEGTACLPDR